MPDDFSFYSKAPPLPPPPVFSSRLPAGSPTRPSTPKTSSVPAEELDEADGSLSDNVSNRQRHSMDRSPSPQPPSLPDGTAGQGEEGEHALPQQRPPPLLSPSATTPLDLLLNLDDTQTEKLVLAMRWEATRTARMAGCLSQPQSTLALFMALATTTNPTEVDRCKLVTPAFSSVRF